VSTISTPDWSYTLTPEDKFWAAKMVEKEGGNAAADLWTMASRFAYFSKVRYPTFTSLIRQYSVPIQADEERYRAWQSEPARPELAALVDRWARGEIPNPVPRAAHFARGDFVSRVCLQRTDEDRCVTVVGRFPADRPPERQNWYTTTPTTETWPDNYVRVGGAGDGPVVALPGVASSGSSSSGGSGGLGILLAGVAIVGAAFYFGRRR